MTLTVNAKSYNADSYQKDSIGYVGPAHTASAKDMVKLARIAPKKTTVSSGVAKTSAKLTRTLTLTGALEPTRDAITEFTANIPVGFTGADIDSMLNDMGAFIASATFKTHVKSQLISF